MPSCPICSRPVAPLGESPAFPFCSRACRLVDLGKWLDGDYKVPGLDGEVDLNGSQDRQNEENE